jgi:hypothetical protein
MARCWAARPGQLRRGQTAWRGFRRRRPGAASGGAGLAAAAATSRLPGGDGLRPSEVACLAPAEEATWRLRGVPLSRKGGRRYNEVDA